MIPFISDNFTDISHDLRNTLIDEYANEKAPSDGEVYRKLRQYQNEHNAQFQKRWWARLSENKAKRLRQLMSPDNVDICAAFDALLPIPGLWDGMSFGSLNRVLALKCDEVSHYRYPQIWHLPWLMAQEIIHYLQHVKVFWSSLVSGDRDQMAKIDIQTVEVLQLRAPAACSSETRAVKGLILSGEAFSRFTETERSNIWERMATREACDGIIPSLRTFFRDVKYLEACGNGMKQLAECSKGSTTVRAAMKHVFELDGSRETCLVQISETTFRSHAGSRSNFFELAYRQLWLFVMRFYPQLGREATSKKVVAKTNCGKADEVVLYNMAALSQKLGFNSTSATDWLNRSPDRHVAREALLKARNPGSYRYDLFAFESLIDRVVECFASAVAHEALPPSELVIGRTPTIQSRCGLPRQDPQLLDRHLLFLDRIHAREPSLNVVSSFYVRQSVYFAFFGKPLTDTKRRPHGPENGLQSPLFVPVDDPPFTPLPVSTRVASSLRKGSRRELRRERLIRRQEERGGFRRQERSETVGNKEPFIPADSHTPANDEQDTAMNDLVQVTSEAEDITTARSPSDIDIGEDNYLTSQYNHIHSIRSSPETGSEVLADVNYEEQGQDQRTAQEDKGKQVEQEEHFSLQPAETRSILEDSEYESSSLSERDIQDGLEENDCQPMSSLPDTLSQPSGLASYSLEYPQSSNILAEEQEIPRTAEFSEEILRDDSRASSPRQPEQLLSITQSDCESLNGRSEEMGPAEDAVQQELQKLEQEAEVRARTTSSTRTPEGQPALATSEPISPSEPDEATFAQYVNKLAEGSASNEKAPVPGMEANQIIRQGLIARTARAEKGKTQFEFIKEQKQVQEGHQVTTGSSNYHEFSESEPPITTKKTLVNVGDPREPALQGLRIGEFTVPPLTEALQPQQILSSSTTRIIFKAYEKGEWKVTDQVQVDPNDPSEAERIAFKYARKENQHARFYNKALRLVTAAQCTQAAIDDGSNIVLMSLWQDLKVTRDKVAEVAEMVKADGEKQDEIL